MPDQIKEQGNMAGERLNRLKKALIKEALVSREQMYSAEEMARREDRSLRGSLVKSGFVTEEALGKFISLTFQIPYVDLKNYTIDRKVLDQLSDKIARRYQVIPLFERDVIIAMERDIAAESESLKS